VTKQKNVKAQLAVDGEKYDGSLDTLLKNNDISIGQRIDIAYQIVQGMQHYMKMKYAHCDLKPQNIFYKKEDARFVVAVADFGAAKHRNNLNTGRIAHTRVYTDMQAIAGAVDSLTDSGAIWSLQKHDIYSLGITLCQILLKRNTTFTPESLEQHLKYYSSAQEIKELTSKHPRLVGLLKKMIKQNSAGDWEYLKEKTGIGKIKRPSIEEIVETLRISSGKYS
jgi:serine/threonine protein kinase